MRRMIFESISPVPIDANALRSLAPADTREFVNDWDWPHASNVQLSIRGPSAAAATWKGDGILQLQRGRFRTIGFNSASANVHFGDGAVTYENFRVARGRGRCYRHIRLRFRASRDAPVERRFGSATNGSNLLD